MHSSVTKNKQKPFTVLNKPENPPEVIGAPESIELNKLKQKRSDKGIEFLLSYLEPMLIINKENYLPAPYQKFVCYFIEHFSSMINKKMSWTSKVKLVIEGQNFDKMPSQKSTFQLKALYVSLLNVAARFHQYNNQLAAVWYGGKIEPIR